MNVTEAQRGAIGGLAVAVVCLVASGCSEGDSGNKSRFQDGSASQPDAGREAKPAPEDVRSGPEREDTGAPASDDAAWEAGRDVRPLPPDSRPPCSDLQANGPILPVISNLTAPIGGFAGGTILDGTYELTSENCYLGGSLGEDLGVVQRTIRISGSATRIDLAWNGATRSAGELQPMSYTNASGTLSLAPPELTIALTCGASGTFTYSYAVNENRLVFAFRDPRRADTEFEMTYDLVGFATGDRGVATSWDSH